MIAAIEKNREYRRESDERRAENEVLRTRAILKLVEGAGAHVAPPPPTTKEQRQLAAEDLLGKLETSDELAGRADVKIVLRKVREVLYGSDPGRAASTVARLYALSARNAPDDVCVMCLSELGWDDT